VRFTRREALKLAAALPLGAALAGPGCPSPAPPAGARRLRGGIIGAADDRGHRLLRDGGGREAASDPAPAVRTGVAIVGAGVAGLSAAWRLRRAGFEDLVVLELEDRPGGTSAFGENEVSAYPLGAHYLVTPPPEARGLRLLLEDLGVITGYDAAGRPDYRADAIVAAPVERLFVDGRWIDGLYPRPGATAGDLAQLEAFEAEIARLARFRDGRGRRAFALPRAAGSDAPEVLALDRLSMAAWLAEKGLLGSARLRWFVEYACRDDYCARLETTSAYAGLHYFLARAGEDRDPDHAPYTLAWPEGNGRFVRRLVEPLRDRLRTGVVVTEVREERDGVVLRAHDVAAARAFEVRAKAAVIACPLLVAARLLAPLRPDAARAAAASLEYGSWLVGNLIVSRRPGGPGAPLSWDNVLFESDSLGYVHATHARPRPDGRAVLTYYLPFPDADGGAARRRLLETTFEGWADRILADLGRAHPDIRETALELVLWRWGHAMVRPRPGLFTGDALGRAGAPSAGGRARVACADMSGLPLFEEAHYRGVLAAEETLRALGRRVESVL